MDLLHACYHQPAFGAKCQKGAKKDYRASNVLVIGGRANWIVLAGGRRPPLITQRLGGRPKVARACSLLILAPCLESPLHLPSNSAIASRSNSTENISTQIPFGPPWAGLNF